MSEDGYDPMRFGPKARAVVEGMYRACETEADVERLSKCFANAWDSTGDIKCDADAYCFGLFFGYRIGKQTHGAIVLPDFIKALEAGYEAAIHEDANELETSS
jgi:hypothetical protein